MFGLVATGGEIGVRMTILYKLPQGGEELGVLCLGADGDAEAVVAEGDARAVPDDDAFLDEVVVDTLRVGHAGKEEIGIGRIDF